MPIENSLSDMMRRVMFKSPIGNLGDLEHRVTEMPGAHLWTEDSPVRFEIMEEGMKRGSAGPGGSRSIRIMGPTMLGILRSLRSLSKNPSQPKTEAPADLLADLEAIMPEPQRHGNGQITYVSNERCFPYFSDYYGCSVCIAICPFSRTSYERVKQQFVKAEG